MRTILATNAATAYAAGRWKAQAANAAARPFWQYVAVRDARTRPGHLALDGRVWAADDPVWQSIYPPNGFNCRCRTRALTARQVERRGLRPGSDGRLEADTVPAGRDSVTGEAVEVPTRRAVWRDADGAERSFTPDPGWAYNPGRESYAFRDGGTPPARAAAGQPDWRSLGLRPARDIPAAEPPPALPTPPDRAAAMAAVEDALGLSDSRQRRRVRTPVDTVMVDQRTAQHVTEKNRNRARYANRIAPTLEDPDEVWVALYDDGGYRTLYLKRWRERRRNALAVAVEGPDARLLWNFIPTESLSQLDRLRVGARVWPQERGE